VNYKDGDHNYTERISCKIGSTKVLSRDYENSRIYKQGVVRRHPLVSLQKNYVVHRILIGGLYMHRHLPLRRRTICHRTFLPSVGLPYKFTSLAKRLKGGMSLIARRNAVLGQRGNAQTNKDTSAAAGARENTGHRTMLLS
jgi:hypothetical protein